jgi:limonene-1,2-epoxide hydrolase
VVRGFFEAMQRRDWAAVEQLTSRELSVWWPVTLERFEGSSFVDMNRAYPEGWAISVSEVLEDGDRVAARVRVDQADVAYWCFGFYTVGGGVITEAIEGWLVEGGEDAPDWRAPFRLSR